MFKTETGYKLLDDRIRLSFNKMDQLLAPLNVGFKVPLDQKVFSDPWLQLGDKKIYTKDMRSISLTEGETPDFSQVSSHNNESERDIRCRVIKRKISLFNRTLKGAKAWDIYLSLLKTCQKNGINFYKYILDRLTYKNKFPQISEIIQIA